MKLALTNLLMRRNRGKTAFEVEEELQFHMDMLQRKYMQHGMSAAEAKAAAAKRFGNFERVKQQCVDISSRSSLLRRVLKVSSVLIALTGVLIHIVSPDYKITRIGTMFIMIAVFGRLLLYVRGLPRHVPNGPPRREA